MSGRGSCRSNCANRCRISRSSRPTRSGQPLTDNNRNQPGNRAKANIVWPRRTHSAGAGLGFLRVRPCSCGIEAGADPPEWDHPVVAAEFGFRIFVLSASGEGITGIDISKGDSVSRFGAFSFPFRRKRVGFEPQRTSGGGRINASFFPPLRFIAAAVDFAMVTAAERNSELIADLAAKCPALHKPEMMGIGRLSPADQARMLGDRSDVIPVTRPTGFGHGKHAFVDRVRAPPALWFRCQFIWFTWR
jgi:hypothetical protein